MSDAIDTRDVFTKAELLAEIDRLRADLWVQRAATEDLQERLDSAGAGIARVLERCDAYSLFYPRLMSDFRSAAEGNGQ